MPGGLEKLHGLSPFLAWCLSSSPLISLSHSAFSFFHLLPSLPCSLFLCLRTIFPHSTVRFLSSSPLSVSRCHCCPVAFFTPLPCDIPLFLFLPPLSSFLAVPLPLPSFRECVALAIPLALPTRLTLDQHDWTWAPWVLLAGQFSAKRSVLRRDPRNP